MQRESVETAEEAMRLSLLLEVDEDDYEEGGEILAQSENRDPSAMSDD